MKAYMLALLFLALTGCSKEPNQEQITDAVKSSVQESNEAVKANVKQMSEMTASAENMIKENADNTHIKMTSQALEILSKPLLFKVIDVQKLGDCKAQEKKGVTRCSTKITTENSDGKLSKTIDVDFIQTEKGNWVVYDNEDDKS